jgi:hypothetical protein
MIDPLLTVILAFLALPLVLLGVHIFRDIRGGKRNREKKCYSCGTGGRQLWPVSHNKGGLYFYCDQCQRRQELFLGTFSIVGGFVVIAFFVLMFLTKAWP